MAYFFDSYAVIAQLEGNPSYARFSQEYPTITIFNLAEIYWTVTHTLSESEANLIYEKYASCVVSIPDDILKEAIKFRKLHKKKNLSYTDCIGYIYALKNNMKFLTGDQQFEHLPNVEFVK
ncbi:MAG TPA: PIN domain-containing protein [Candidatus Nanoarchaeia archaeon]|nr:PIN domain-containing protein [Candidatus Nanoarchaeia archaeon]